MTVVADTGDDYCTDAALGDSASNSPSSATSGGRPRWKGTNNTGSNWRKSSQADREKAIRTEMLEWGEGIFPQIAHGFLGSGLRARLVVNDERQVLWASEVALALLEPQFPVVIADGALCFERANDPVACQEWLHSVGRKPSRFLVSGAQEDWWVVMNAWRGRLHADTAIYAEFILSHPPYRSSTSGMSKQFGLTPAECDVIDALVRLETPTKIADRLGVSINTVRTHIRRLYGKLGVNTQVQLIRIATAFSAG